MGSATADPAGQLFRGKAISQFHERNGGTTRDGVPLHRLAGQTDRKAFLMELDPSYCDVIVQRWEKFTGRKAERMKSGKELSI